MGDYIKLEEIKKQQRKDKAKELFNKLKAGAQKVGSNLQHNTKVVGSKIGKGVVKGAKAIKQYQEKAPEREKAQIERLKREAEILRQQNKVRSLRGKTYGTGSSVGFGGGMGFGMGMAQPKAVTKKKKGSAPRYAVVNGKAYQIAGSTKTKKKAKAKQQRQPFNPFAF